MLPLLILLLHATTPHARTSTDLGLNVAQPLRATVAEPAVPTAHPQSRGGGGCGARSQTTGDESLKSKVGADPADLSCTPLDPGCTRNRGGMKRGHSR
jgi:hypothetical protein